MNAKVPHIDCWETRLKVKAKLADKPDDQLIPIILGSFARRFRAAAKGEWMINAVLPSSEALQKAKVSPTYIQHAIRIDILSKRPYDWSPCSSSTFIQKCRAADRKLDYLFFKDFYQLVENSTGIENTYTPSLQEFLDDTVTLPKTAANKATEAIRNRKDILIFGDHSCGKTVFGISVALKWIEENNGRCLFFDFRDFVNDDNYESNMESDIDCYLELEGKPLLILLDNVHLWNAQAQLILSYIYELRSRNHFVNIILLSLRNPIEKVKLKGPSEMVPIQIELVADEESFICVARRLCLKANCSYSFDEMERHASSWKNCCGANLAVFSAAFNPSRIDKINNTTIHKLVDTEYIWPLEKANKIEEFLELCLLSSLDISAPYRTMWGQGIEDLFPKYVQNGLVIREQQVCRLFHSSFGELVTDISLPRNTGTNLSEILCNRLLHIVERCPNLIFTVYQRICLKGYNHLINKIDILDSLKKNSSLITKLFIQAPFSMCNVLKADPSIYSIEILLQKLSTKTSNEFLELVQSLEFAKIIHVVFILGFLDQQSESNQSRVILSSLIERGRVLKELESSALTNIIDFLRLLDANDFSDNSIQWIDCKINDETFYNKILFSPCQFVRRFLEYLDDINHENDSLMVLEKLLSDAIFFERLIKQSCDLVVIFLNYCEIKLPIQVVKKYVIKIVSDFRFSERVAQTKCSFIVILLKFLISIGLREQADILVKELFNNRVFFNSLADYSRSSLMPFLRYLDTHGYKRFLNELDDILGIKRPEYSSIEKSFLSTLLEKDAEYSEEYFREVVLKELESYALVKIVDFLYFFDKKGLSSESTLWIRNHVEKETFYINIRVSPCQYIRRFLIYLEDEKYGDLGLTILIRLLADDLFFGNLLVQQCDMIVIFLQYSTAKLPNWDIRDYVIRLITDIRFFEKFTSTSCQVVVFFLQYLRSLGLREHADFILSNLFNNQEFIYKLSITSGTLVASLKRFLQAYGYKSLLAAIPAPAENRPALDKKRTVARSNSQKAQFASLHENRNCDLAEYQNQITAMLIEQNESIPDYINYLLCQRSDDEAYEIIKNYIVSLTPEVFRTMLINTKTAKIRLFQKFIKKHPEIEFPPDLWNESISIMKERGYFNYQPDIEFSQARLISLDIYSLVYQFRDIVIKTHSKHRLNCVFHSLISDLEVYNKWLQHLTMEEKRIYNFALDQLEIFVPEGIKTY